jgi:hypothetical protein
MKKGGTEAAVIVLAERVCVRVSLFFAVCVKKETTI